MPHQRHIVDVAFELDPDTGLLAYSEVVVIGPRQATGKTELMLPTMAHRCLGFDDELIRWVRAELGIALPVPGPQRVLYTAQNADSAREKWRDVHLERLKHSKLRGAFKARLRLAAEAMIWRNGSSWSPGSTTGKTGGTGDTIDMGVIDEAWSRENNRTELGMRPAMLTRPWRQLWVLSMIPGLSRALPGTWPYLAGKRQVGRARVEAGVTRGMAFFDFAAPDGADPADPATWEVAMPGLRRTVSERAVQEDFEAMDLVDFCAEYLGWAPGARQARWTVIGRETWAGLLDEQSTIQGPHALAVEVAEDRTSAWIGAAGRRADGNWHVEVVEPGHKVAQGATGMDWVLPRLLEMVDQDEPCTIVIDPRRPANSLIVPLRNRGVDVLTPNQGDIAGACGRFYDATGEQDPADEDRVDPGVRVYHLAQPELDRALAGARKLDLGEGAFTFVKKGSVSDLGALYVVVLSMHGHEVKAPADYDPLSSIPRVDGQCVYCDAYSIGGARVVHYDDCVLAAR